MEWGYLRKVLPHYQFDNLILSTIVYHKFKKQLVPLCNFGYLQSVYNTKQRKRINLLFRVSMWRFKKIMKALSKWLFDKKFLKPSMHSLKYIKNDDFLLWFCEQGLQIDSSIPFYLLKKKKNNRNLVKTLILKYKCKPNTSCALQCVHNNDLRMLKWLCYECGIVCCDDIIIQTVKDLKRRGMLKWIKDTYGHTLISTSFQTTI